MANPSIIDFVESCFRAFESRRVTYCIMRNADEVVAGQAHDVDLAVDDRQLEEAEECIFCTAEALGWKLLFRTGSAKDKHNIKCYNFYHVRSDGTPIFAHIDIFTSFAWCSHILIDSRHTLQDIDSTTLYHRISPVVEAVTKLFIRLFYNGYIKRKYVPQVLEVFRAEPEKVRACMGLFLAADTAAEVYRLVLAEQWEAIEKMRPRLVADVRRLTHRYRFVYYRYLLGKLWRRSGIMVALEGTDGSGKTTVIEALPSIISNTFSAESIFYYHCRPYVFEPSKRPKKDGANVPCTEPHALRPYGRLKSFAKLLFCIADYIIGYWGPVRWHLCKGHLVIFDRYYYDYYLDKLRYRFTLSDRVIRFFQPIIPKPDLTLVLTGEPEPIWQRKKEIPLEEVQRQIAVLEEQKKHFAHARVVNVVQPVEQVVREVALALAEAQHHHFTGGR